MTPEEAVCERILSLSAVTALTGQRWFVLALPQGVTYPCGRVSQVDDLPRYHLRGPLDLVRSRIQVDVYVTESAAASAGLNPYTLLSRVFDAVDGDGLGHQASGLSGWIGTAGGSPPALEVSCVERLDRTARYDPAELRVLTMSADYYVWWRA